MTGTTDWQRRTWRHWLIVIVVPALLLYFTQIRLDLANLDSMHEIVRRQATVVVPLYYGTVAVLFVITIPRRTRASRRAAGLCPACGYDLRASTARCPECGREIDGKPPVS